MKRKDIEKAAEKYAEENSWYPGETSYESDIIAIEESFADAFKAGVKWRINSVWNDERKTPNKSDLILVEFPDGRFDIVYFHSIKSWRSMVKRNGTIRWAYLEDLKPDKEK